MVGAWGLLFVSCKIFGNIFVETWPKWFVIWIFASSQTLPTEKKKTAGSDVAAHSPQAFLEANQILEVTVNVTWK